MLLSGTLALKTLSNPPWSAPPGAQATFTRFNALSI